MIVYTRDSAFLRRDTIDAFTSLIWTERYREPGEVNLVVPASTDAIDKLREGTFLSIPESKEIMLIDTQSIKDGQLTVTGKTLTNFLTNRELYVRQSNEYPNASQDGTPGLIMDYLVLQTIGPPIAGGGFPGLYEPLSLMGGDLNSLTNLSCPRQVASIGHGDDLIAFGDDTGPWVSGWQVTNGTLLERLIEVANAYDVGFSLFLNYAVDAGYELTFFAFKGVDRTSASVHEVVQFSLAQDTLTGIEEVHSIAGYRNVAYVFPPAFVGSGTALIAPGVAYATPEAETATDFERRVIVEVAEDLKYEDDGLDHSDIVAALAQRAANLLANNNYVRMADGEIVPQTKYKFGVDYGLGDFIELNNNRGILQKVQVTEYIRSQDATGERAYPTVTVVS